MRIYYGLRKKKRKKKGRRNTYNIYFAILLTIIAIIVSSGVGLKKAGLNSWLCLRPPSQGGGRIFFIG